MSLLKSWAPYFRSSARSQGRADQRAGKVVQLPPEGDELVRAEVRDAQAQTVTISRAAGNDVAHCTCRTFAAGAYCRHIWATLLDVQGRGLMSDETVGVSKATQPAAPKARKRSGDRPVATLQQRPDWMSRLSLLRPSSLAAAALPWQANVEVWYLIHAQRSVQHGGIVLEVCQQSGAAPGRPKPLRIDGDVVARLHDPGDRAIGAALLGARPFRLDDMDRVPAAERPQAVFHLRSGAQRALVRQIVRTGRCLLEDQGRSLPLRWDADGQAGDWALWLVGQMNDETLTLTLELRRGDERMAIDEPSIIVAGRDGLVIRGDRASALDDRGATRWVTQFRDQILLRGEQPALQVPREDISRFLDRLYVLPQLPELALPPELARPQRLVTPAAQMELFTRGLEQEGLESPPRDQLLARASFDYAGVRVSPAQAGKFVAEPDQGPGLIRRDLPFEHEAMAQLAALGFRANPIDGGQTWLLPLRDMAEATQALTRGGWRVWADRRTLRAAATPTLSVRTGIDWFELHGGVAFDTGGGGRQTVPLPQVLAAAQSGQNMVRLDDGAEGLIPTEWLRKLGLLAALGSVEEDHLRFKLSQGALLDAMLEQRELVATDPPFEEARRRLHEFDRVEPLHETATFHGELRTYQREGLGWLAFLRWFHAGGILADDMGLGKTIQVLAMLEERYGDRAEGGRAEGQGTQEVGLRSSALGPGPLALRPGPLALGPSHQPTLIVAPRSVIFNWIDEAAKFAPNLRVQAYTGADRQSLRDAFTDHDVIVTSYGLMRRDIADLAEHTFDYVVLDEAQAIKNPASQAAKAARLLRAEHRLALTGTPVENHLGDIWSIFEFLNPGMLGTAGRFGELVRLGVEDPRSNDAAFHAARALRPFILRRTKKQVMAELPEKTEQSIVCELEPAQRRLYDQLLAHYRGTLLTQITTPNVGGSSMMVLEALLRLRQAACHPGLIDAQYMEEPSAKLETLLENLTELIEEGHKALVFSQFTSLLAIVRKRFEQQGIVYEYLDGQTRDRRAPVERFQNDPACSVFLISLKAGGLGLNLTAAEYVFILDPWWNPAVEAQAIDRAHRIGQTQHVFAYRLIAADTVEQRIAELQQKKQQLADAIVGGQGNLLQNLTRDDLQRLLS